nr:hypothetical protein [uncultured Lichenicoccus sp.]
MISASGESLRLAIFTICSNNYMPFAQVLFASLRRHHPDAALFLCLADRLNDTPGSGPRDWTVIEANDLPIPDFAGFAFRYDIMEFNTALKPFMFLHLLEARGFDAVVYLDPDIELFAPLAGVLAALQSGASFVFTPHLCAPSEHRAEPNDLSMMRAGAYNLGFLAVSRCEETVVLLGWWARRLRTQCVNAQAEGLFVDQKFMDLIPSFASNAAISHDTTLNVAYWNLEQRTLDRTAEGWTVDGAPLTFFHFSGFNPRLPHRLSRHSPRFVGDLPPPLAALTAQYAERLWMQGHGSFPGVSYTYGRFASGTPIHPVIRAMFRDQRPAGGGRPVRRIRGLSGRSLARCGAGRARPCRHQPHGLPAGHRAAARWPGPPPAARCRTPGALVRNRSRRGALPRPRFGRTRRYPARRRAAGDRRDPRAAGRQRDGGDRHRAAADRRRRDAVRAPHLPCAAVRRRRGRVAG